MATILHGGATVVLSGFAEDDLYQDQWLRPSLVTAHPDPDPQSLADEVARKRNQERYSWLVAWLLSLLATATVTYVLAVR